MKTKSNTAKLVVSLSTCIQVARDPKLTHHFTPEQNDSEASQAVRAGVFDALYSRPVNPPKQWIMSYYTGFMTALDYIELNDPMAQSDRQIADEENAKLHQELQQRTQEILKSIEQRELAYQRAAEELYHSDHSFLYF